MQQPVKHEHGYILIWLSNAQFMKLCNLCIYFFCSKTNVSSGRRRIGLIYPKYNNAWTWQLYIDIWLQRGPVYSHHIWIFDLIWPLISIWRKMYFCKYMLAKKRKKHIHISIDLRDFCGPMYFLSSWRLAWECHLYVLNSVCIFWKKQLLMKWIMTSVHLIKELFWAYKIHNLMLNWKHCITYAKFI